MIFSNNAKIAIIDDKYDEVASLMKNFSKLGVPYSYFDGSMESEPSSPFDSIRLIFLDLNLGDRFVGANPKICATNLASYLSKIISSNSSPFAILFWTNNTELIEEIPDAIRQAGLPMAFHVNMEKRSAREMASMSIEEFEQEFISKITDDSFHYLLWWELFIQNKIGAFVNKISDIANLRDEDSWNDNIKHILAKLSCSYTGKDRVEADQSVALKYATTVLTHSFSESLPKNQSSISIQLPSKPVISIETIAKLNTMLFIECVNDREIENGKVFEEDDDELFVMLKKEILQNPSEVHSTLVSAILTPSCDIAHEKKLLKNERNKVCHNILSGLKLSLTDGLKTNFKYNEIASSVKKRIESVMECDSTFSQKINDCVVSNSIPENCSKETLEYISKKTTQLNRIRQKIEKCISQNKPDAVFISQPFMDTDNRVCIFVFHFGTLRIKMIGNGDVEFKYLLKGSLMSDLQSKLSNHVNRLGNSMLEY